MVIVAKVEGGWLTVRGDESATPTEDVHAISKLVDRMATGEIYRLTLPNGWDAEFTQDKPEEEA